MPCLGGAPQEQKEQRSQAPPAPSAAAGRGGMRGMKEAVCLSTRQAGAAPPFRCHLNSLISAGARWRSPPGVRTGRCTSLRRLRVNLPYSEGGDSDGANGSSTSPHGFGRAGPYDENCPSPASGPQRSEALPPATVRPNRRRSVEVPHQQLGAGASPSSDRGGGDPR